MNATPRTQAANVVPIIGPSPENHQPAPELPPFGTLIRIAEVSKITTLSKSQIYKLARAGKFPAPIKLSENTSVWDSTAVYQFIDDRKKAAQGGE